MKLTILSCERTPSYLDKTLAHIHDIDVDITYQYKNTPYYNKESKVINIENHKHDSDNLQIRSTYNYIQALRMQNDIILEDDVVACSNLSTKVDNVIRLVTQNNLTNYIIAFYACYIWNWHNKLELVNYPIQSFYGTQAVMIDKETRTRLADYMEKNIGKMAYDFLIKEFCRDNNISLLVTNYSLVQHAGAVSTGLGYHHQCANFIDDHLPKL